MVKAIESIEEFRSLVSLCVVGVLMSCPTPPVQRSGAPRRRLLGDLVRSLQAHLAPLRQDGGAVPQAQVR